MSYKTILTHVDAAGDAEARIRLAMQLAGQFEAALIGLGAEACWPYINPAEARDRRSRALVRQAEADLAEAEARFHALTGGFAGEALWRAVVDLPANAVARHARAADLVVASPRHGPDDPHLFADLGDLIMRAGLPVLLAPRETKPFTGETVVVGWKNTREGRQAVSLGLPFLKRASRVVVAAVGERGGPGDEAPLEVEDVCQRLRRHGVSAEGHLVARAARPIARELDALAAANGADLIIVGAYAHSRLNEWLLGGVTRDLIAGSPNFILFAR